MTGLAIGLALIAALVAGGFRVARRRRFKRRLAALPGGSAQTAMVVTSFTDIEEEIARRRCPCGGRIDSIGEGSLHDGDRRLRAVAVECRFCERRGRVYFDVTRLLH